MKKIIRSNAPVLLVGLTWLLYALFFPMYGIWYAVPAFLSFVVYIAASTAISPKIIEITPEEEPEVAEPTEQPINQDVGAAFAKGKDYIRQIYDISLRIRSAKIGSYIGEIVLVCDRIFYYVENHIEKIKDIHLFMNYYLPTTVELLKSYEELEKQKDLGGTTILGAMGKIEDSVDKLRVAYKNLLDDLHSEKAINITAEATVLQNMLERQGLLKNDF
jgi:hypothetical protein